MASQTEIALSRFESWITLADAARAAQRKEGTLRGWVKVGKVRAYETGRYVWLFRDDLIYCVRETYQRKQVFTLVERGVAPLEADGLNGFELIQWAQDTGYRKLLSPLPVDPDLPEEGRADLRALRDEVSQLRATVQALAGQMQLPARLPSIGDAGAQEIMEKLYEGLQKVSWSLPEVQAYLRLLGGLDTSHYEAFEAWAISYPEVAQEICGEGLPPHTPVIRLAYTLKNTTKTRAENHSPALQGLAAQAETVLKHVEERCRERAILWTLRQGTVAPLGSCQTDQWILKKLL